MKAEHYDESIHRISCEYCSWSDLFSLGRVFDKKADSDKDVRFMMVPSIEKGTCCGHILFLCLSH